MTESEPPTATEPIEAEPSKYPPRVINKRPRHGGTKSRLTPELQALLCEVHERDKDYRVATAITCDVHPRLLDSWLRDGLKDDAVEPFKSFAFKFLKTEMRIRAAMLKELLEAKSKPKVAALTWMIERRFRQWRIDYMPSDWEHEAIDVLATMGKKAGLSLEQKKYLINAMLTNPTGPVLQLLRDNGWVQHLPSSQELPDVTRQEIITTGSDAPTD